MAFDADVKTNAPRMTLKLELSILLTRVLLGLYFGLAGVYKSLGEINQGIGTFYEKAYKPLQPWFVPDFVGMPMGYALPCIEIVLGFLLIVGFFTRWVSGLIAVLLLSFTMALVMANGSITGGAPGPFHSNIILMGVCVIFIAMGAGRFGIDPLVFRSQRKAERKL